ncbi:NAD-dependent epimerase/dehydratase family protein [Kibdelosporangium phytohabitans]|uniref:Oxidoreductase n=1 Tax=Kibdelosporangium phytohabitans TaxID=860235 RepID=A0A0N7F3S5_9PSEU|nr:NAD-dependent epimerase/dehydratase [Kibdelosporangium phytohabitans]ALG09447.1 oxidoreductase [Kibdelosporangium phytohabitans]MBE1469266.1 dTDP-4-keto-6-deoxyhexose 4-ketoreductase [Kibdelosporangium phytohabitans]
MSSKSSRRSVVVLGASGLLGTAVTRELAGLPVDLRVVGRRLTSVPERPVADVEVRTADLTEPHELARAIAGADAIVHLVAHIAGPATWRVSAGDAVAERVNLGLVHDLISVLRAQRPATPPVVLFAGSMSQVGHPTGGRIDGTEPDNPLTTYDRQKQAAENALKAATADGVLRGATLRLATLFSQGTDSISLDRGVVSAMARRAWAGEPLTMWHDGTVKRDLLCVDDAAAAFASALDHADALAGRHWLVGTGLATSIADLFGSIAEAMSTATGKPAVPVISTEPAGQSMQTDQLDFVLDPGPFGRATGWQARIALAEALKRTAVAIADHAERTHAATTSA